jgi:hypothetical protein
VRRRVGLVVPDRNDARDDVLVASQTLNAVPSGSAKTAIRQAFMKSKGSTVMPPPASMTFDAASSALSTQK